MPEPYDLHNSPGYQLTLLSRINERRFDQGISPLGLSRVKWCVLLAVGQEGHQAPSDIAGFIGIDRTATSRALRALESDGLITRCGGQSDRRTRKVTITKDGATRLARANTIARASAERLLSKLSWYERETLSTIIEKLMAGETRDVAGL